MSAQKPTARGLFVAVLGTIGFSALAGLLVTVMVAPAIAVTGMTANNSIGVFEALPDYIELDQQHQVNQIVAWNKDKTKETLIAEIYDQNREEVALDQIDDDIKWAAIDGEDRRFYTHGGVDIPSVVRAALGGGKSGGASTLTMQLVRNTLVLRAVNNTEYTEEERTAEVEKAVYPDLNRKLKEMKYAISLEKRYTKDEILQGYLNIVGMGGNSYGVQAGAEQFFNTSAADVTPAQAASLIAIVQNPSANTLIYEENYAANQARRDVILGFMYAQGHLTKAQYDEAIATPVDATTVTLTDPKSGCLAAKKEFRFPCDYALKSIVRGEVPTLGTTAQEQLDNFRKGGYKIYLTINPSLQRKSTEAIQRWAPKNETRFRLGAAASTVKVGTGEILVMAQNKDFNDTLKGGGPTTTAVNFNADSDHGGGTGFQPGSSYKPYTLLAFLAAGHGLGESFNAGKLEVNLGQYAAGCEHNEGWGGKWKFKNDSGEKGSWTVQRATASSVNSVFMQMASELDQCDIRDIARSLGVHKGGGAKDGSDLSMTPSCVLGGCANSIAPLTQAAAYAAIANKGVYCKPIIIKQIISPAGEELGGQDAECGQSLVQPAVANTAAYAMQGVFTGGTATSANPSDGTPYLGKTGTTNDAEHVWLVGSSTRASTALWIGNIKGKQSLRQISVSGMQAALLRLPLFRQMAVEIDKTFPGKAFPAPDDKLLVGNPVYVPDVIGMSPEEAKAAIELNNLSYKSGGKVDSNQPAGTVVRTDPGTGAKVARGTTVKVFVSNGLGIEVPDVVSDQQGYDAAVAEMNAAGFTDIQQTCVEATEEESPVEMVVAQDPKAGKMANPGTKITLTVRREHC